jgi:hypothetical protein
MPLIPLCGSAQTEVSLPSPAIISSKSLDKIVGLMINRLKVVMPSLLKDAPGGGLLTFLLKRALSFPLGWFVKKQLRQALTRGLFPNVEGQRAED